MKEANYKIYTLGCKVNQYDSAKISVGLNSKGFKEVSEDADFVLINSCSVTKKAIAKSRSLTTKAKNENPNAKIILTGCWPKAYKDDEAINKLYDLVIPGQNLEDILKKFSELKYITETSQSHSPLLASTDKARYFVKIQDGCEQFCSYCIIPYTRGKLKSRPSVEVLNEIKLAADRGFREIVLCGIHLGLYGKEKGNKEKIDLIELIKQILEIKNLGRIRLSSIELNEVKNELVDQIALNKKLCKHLHIPLQGGSDKLLKMMNRPYDKHKFINKIKEIRKIIPEIAVTTDIIVGFPGETDSDFKETINLAKNLKFSKIHVFSFSAHEKTPAFILDNQIAKEKIKERSKILRGASLELEKKYKQKFKNKKLKIVVEKIDKKKIKGKTEFYFDIEKHFNKKKLPKIGSIIEL